MDTIHFCCIISCAFSLAIILYLLFGKVKCKGGKALSPTIAARLASGKKFGFSGDQDNGLTKCLAYPPPHQDDPTLRDMSSCCAFIQGDDCELLCASGMWNDSLEGCAACSSCMSQ